MVAEKIDVKQQKLLAENNAKYLKQCSIGLEKIIDEELAREMPTLTERVERRKAEIRASMNVTVKC